MKEQEGNGMLPVNDQVEFRKMLSLRQCSPCLVSKESLHQHEEQAQQPSQQPIRKEELSPQQTKLQNDCEFALSSIDKCIAQADQFLIATLNCKDITEKQRERLHTQRKVLEMLYLLESRSKPSFRKIYSSLFRELDRFAVPENHIGNSLNHVMLETVHRKELEYLKFYEKNVRQLAQAVDEKGYIDGGFVNFSVKRCKVLVSKLYTISEIYPYACVTSKNDLFSDDLNTSERWAILKKKAMTVRILGDRRSVQGAFTVPLEAINIINAMVSKVNELSQSIDISRSENFVLVLKGGFHVLNYAFISEKAQRRAEFFLAEPDSGVARDVWNLPESGFARPFIDLMMPSMRWMEVLYIPRHFPIITMDRVGKWVSQMNFAINDQVVHESPEISNIRRYTTQLLEVCGDKNERIAIRVMSPFPIEMVMKNRPNFLQKIGSYMKFGSKPKTPESVILHIHGGGFISQSSYVHQLYTRNWANNLNTAIFSVDYRLAPDYQYPAALDDCYQAYMWMISYLHKVFDVPAQSVVLVGDSAGGNIIAALTGLLVKLSHPVPKGIVMVYPALSLTFSSYSPSLLNSLDDMLLPHTFLKMCLSCYVPEEIRAELDPFVSPIRFSDEILSKFPPCRMFVGNRDPFHDDCCRLAERLMRLNRNVHLTVYDNMTHAFLQMDSPFKQLKYSRMAIAEIEGALRQLLKLP